MTKQVLESALAAELTEHLGHEYGDTPTGSNIRNGTRSKTVLTQIGPVQDVAFSAHGDAQHHVERRVAHLAVANLDMRSPRASKRFTGASVSKDSVILVDTIHGNGFRVLPAAYLDAVADQMH